MSCYQIIKIGNHELVHITEYRKLEYELSEANEYARKLNLKITDLCKERDSLKATLQRKQDGEHGVRLDQWLKEANK